MERRWTILLVLFVCRCAFAFQFQSIASTAPQLRDSLGIGYGEIGVLIGLYNLPGIFLALPGSLLGRRWGDKAICALGLGLMTAGGLLIAGSHGYALASAGRVISGAGSILFNIVITKMATDWFAGREIVFAMATIMASWPFGLALALVVQGAIAQAFGWQAVMLSTSILSAAALAMVALLYRDAPGGAARPSQDEAAMPPRHQIAPVLVASLLWSSFNLGLIFYFSFGPLALVAGGRAQTQAAGLISTALWIGIVSIPVCGLVIQKMPRGRAVLHASFLAAAAGLLLVPGAPLVAAVLVGLAIGPGPGAIMALPSRVVAAGHRMVALGIFYTVYYALTAVCPPIAGFIQDITGRPTAALWLGAGLFVACVPMMPGFEWILRRARAGSADGVRPAAMGGAEAGRGG